MRGSAKGKEPESLSTWKADQQDACIEPRYDDLAGDPKQSSRLALSKEQTGQCVYCGRGLELEEHGRYHIEHFRPRKKYPELQLDYSNLFLSCGPRQQQAGLQPTCGNRKEDWFDEDCHVEPSPEEDCQLQFVLASSGRIKADDSLEADQMIKVLNLNHCELIAERSKLIEYLVDCLRLGIPFSSGA